MDKPKQTNTPTTALTREQVQQELGIGSATFFKYVREYPQEFVTYKSGRNRVMDPEDLQRWKAFCKIRDAK
ncbi:MAG: hypothetical protein RI554_11020 [Trueperaceae bacterium]|nr:hypothetical protein [Trueperaceae bacterium]